MDGADDGDRTRDLHRGRVTRYPLRHVRVEPARRIELRLRPYRERVLPLSLGRRELGAQGSNLEISRSKAERVCRFPYRPSEPPPGATPGWPVLQGPPDRWIRGRVRSAGLEPAIPRPSTVSVYHLRHERIGEPPPGVEPGHPPYEGGAAKPCAAARLGNQGSNLDSLASEASVLPDYTIPHRSTSEYAGRDSNPHSARFELASFAGLALPARTPPETRTLCPPIKSRVLHLYSSRRSFTRGYSRSRTGDLPFFKQALVPTELSSHGREAGTRTPSTASQARRAYPYATSRSGPRESNPVSPRPERGGLPSSSNPSSRPPALSSAGHRDLWRRRESNPLRQRLQGATATLAVIPKCGCCGAAPGTELSPGVASLSFAAPRIPAAELNACRHRVFPALEFSMIKPVREARRDGGIRTPTWTRFWRPPLCR